MCGTEQPAAADVSFEGAEKNQAYCDAAQTIDGSFEDEVAGKGFSQEALRTWLTSDAVAPMLDAIEANAPAEIKADVLADSEWIRGPWTDVVEKYDYDARKLMLDGTAADRATFNFSDPAVAEHYAREQAYEEQVCGRTTRRGELGRVLAAQVGDGDRAAMDGLVGEPRAPVRARLADLELRVEIRQGAASPRPRSRRARSPISLIDAGSVKRSRASSGRHSTTSTSRSRARERRAVLGRLRSRCGRRRTSRGTASRLPPMRTLVAMAKPLLSPDALPVEERAVRRAEVGDTPPRGEPLEHRVQPAHRGVVTSTMSFSLPLPIVARSRAELDARADR